MKMIRVGRVKAPYKGLDALRPFQFNLDLFCLVGFIEGLLYVVGHSYLALGITLSFDPLNCIRWVDEWRWDLCQNAPTETFYFTRSLCHGCKMIMVLSLSCHLERSQKTPFFQEIHALCENCLQVKPISSHSYKGKHHVAEIQVEGVMDGDGLRKLTKIFGAPWQSTLLEIARFFTTRLIHCNRISESSIITVCKSTKMNVQSCSVWSPNRPTENQVLLQQCQQHHCISHWGQSLMIGAHYFSKRRRGTEVQKSMHF